MSTHPSASCYQRNSFTDPTGAVSIPSRASHAKVVLESLAQRATLPRQRAAKLRSAAAILTLNLALVAFSSATCLADGYSEVAKDPAQVSPVQETSRAGKSLDELNQVTPRDSMVTEGEQSLLRKVLWYLPNRVIDLVDIFKLDVGVGSAAGGVVRATRYGQIGGRVVDPVSVRFGVRGRDFPFFFERESEYGFCSSFTQTSARHVTPLEFGVGVDLGVGVYAGISLDEIADFFLGFYYST